MDKEFIEKVRESVDIVEIVGRYVNLKRSGKQYRGLCPFHKEKTPSFYVDPEKGLYHCFGCGASGNVFRFLMEMEKLTFTEAVLELAKEAGIPLPEKHIREYSSKALEALEFATNFYYKILFTERGKHALNYLRNRGLKIEIIGFFKLGYAPPEGNAFVKAAMERGFEKKVLIEAGLATEREGFVFDTFRNRVMFPIRNIAGSVVGFGGRALAKDVEPKYLNSPDTPYFKKGELLYGLHEVKGNLRSKNLAILVEGYMDFLMLYQIGIRYGVAPLGTALTDNQANILKRYAKRVFLLYDGDEAGIKAAKRSLPILLSAGIVPKVALLPEGEDPASMVQNGKVDELKNIIKNALDVVDFLLLDERSRAQDQAIVADFINESLEILSKTSDKVYLELLLKQFSEKIGVSVDTLRAKVKAIEARSRSSTTFAVRKTKNDNAKLISGEFRSVAWGFIMSEARTALMSLETKDFEHEDAKCLFEALIRGETTDEVMAQAPETVRNKLAKIIFELKEGHFDKEEVLENVQLFVVKKINERFKKEIITGDSAEIDEKLKYLERLNKNLHLKKGVWDYEKIQKS